MSHGLDIFAKSDLGFAEFVAVVQDITGLRFKQFNEDDIVFYHHVDSDMDVMISQHELDNDRDLIFEDYPFQVSVQSVNVWAGDERNQKDMRLARDLFQQLNASGRFKMMLVENLERRLDDGD